jgi:hypothetical protein
MAPGLQATVQLRTRGRTPAHIFAWVVAYLGVFIAVLVVIALMLLMLGRAMADEIPQQRATVMVMATWKPTAEELKDLRADATACAAGLTVRLDVDEHNVITLHAERVGENAMLFDRTTIAATDLAAAKRLVKAALDDILENLRPPGALRTTKV